MYYLYMHSLSDHSMVYIYASTSSHSMPLPFQYTVVPTRRSTAEAFMNFVGHLLGDAGSPYLLGSVSARVCCLMYVFIFV